jgi:hypothetical protein
MSLGYFYIKRFGGASVERKNSKPEPIIAPVSGLLRLFFSYCATLLIIEPLSD